jgi:tetratricopeptide (TPR) repeat protein
MAVIVLLGLLGVYLPLPFQQTYMLVGNIRDTNGQIVSNVRIAVMDENLMPVRSLLIDSSGRFMIKGLRVGNYMIRIETNGTLYEEQTQRIELFSGRRSGRSEETYPIDFVLKFKKGNQPIASGGLVFAQTVSKEARTEYERGLKHLKSNKADQAILSLKKALEIFPDYYDALEALGVEYVKGSQHGTAIPVLMRALEINRNGTRSYYSLGVAYLNLNRYDEAIEQLEACERLNPSNPNTQMMLGLAYGQNRHPERSEAAFKKALQLGGAEAAQAHFYLAGLYNKQGQYRKAWQELEQFLRQAKDVVDPAGIKTMIEKLKEKEKNPPAARSAPSEPAPLAQGAPSGPDPAATSSAPTITDARSEGKEESAAAANVNAGVAPPERVATPPPPVPPLSPEMQELLKQSAAAGGARYQELLSFTYQLKKTRRVLDEHGKSTSVQEQIFEAYPVRGEHVLIRLSTDGVASRTIGEERKQAARSLEEAEAHPPAADGEAATSNDYVSAGVSGMYQGKSGYISISISALMSMCELYAPRAETIADRPMIAFSFRPRFGAAVPLKYSYLTKLVGTIWIDQADQTVTRVEGWPDSAFDLVASTATGSEAALVYRQERQPSGAWFPSIIRLNARGRADLFNGLNWDVVFEFSNYQRFNTNATEKLNSPPPKE